MSCTSVVTSNTSWLARRNIAEERVTAQNTTVVHGEFLDLIAHNVRDTMDTCCSLGSRPSASVSATLVTARASPKSLSPHHLYTSLPRRPLRSALPLDVLPRQKHAVRRPQQLYRSRLSVDALALATLLIDSAPLTAPRVDEQPATADRTGF